jgi:hypothetical protein
MTRIGLRLERIRCRSSVDEEEGTVMGLCTFAWFDQTSSFDSDGHIHISSEHPRYFAILRNLSVQNSRRSSAKLEKLEHLGTNLPQVLIPPSAPPAVVGDITKNPEISGVTQLSRDLGGGTQSRTSGSALVRAVLKLCCHIYPLLPICRPTRRLQSIVVLHPHSSSVIPIRGYARFRHPPLTSKSRR